MSQATSKRVLQGVSTLQKQRPSVGIVFIGALAVISVLLEFLVHYKVELEPRLLGLSILSAAVAGVLVFWGVQKFVRRVICGSILPDPLRKRYLKNDTLTYAAFLLTTGGAIGFYVPISVVLLLFLLFQALLVFLLMGQGERQMLFSSLGWLSFLFLISGFAALIYQITWQRVLFTIFGVNIESITIIVSIFMLGLGIGAVVGGRLSSRYPSRLPQLFFACEILIGLFGIVSIPLIKAVGMLTLHGSLLTVSLTTYLLLSVPTMFMGASLPILVAYIYRYYKNVGKSVGMLYSINTIGSAIACFITVDVLFSLFGLQISVLIAALLNVIVGILVYQYTRILQKKTIVEEPHGHVISRPTYQTPHQQ